MVDLDRLQKLKKKVKRAQAEADQAEGVLRQLYSQLNEQFSCNSLEEAKSMLADLEEEERSAEKKYQDILDDIERRFGDKV